MFSFDPLHLTHHFQGRDFRLSAASLEKSSSHGSLKRSHCDRKGALGY